MEIKNDRKNLILDSFNAITFLVWTIAKQQWKLFIVLILASVLMIPAVHLFFSMNNDYRTAAGLIAGFAILPSLLILLVFLPIVYNQITSSSIQKRLNASGISKKIYMIAIILFFSLLAIAVWYLMSFFAWLIFNNKEHFYRSINETYIPWTIDIQWFFFIVITPITFFGIASTGLLIGRWKVSELIKGIVVFLIIIGLLSLSRTVVSPYDMVGLKQWVIDDVAIKKARKLDTLFTYLNPWGTMIYTIQYSLVGKILASSFVYQNDVVLDGLHYLESFETFYKIYPTIIYSTIWTFGLTGVVLYFTK